MMTYKREIQQWGRYAILPHIFPDGDTIGSSIALARGLMSAGLHAVIVLDDALPESLTYLNTEAFTSVEGFKALHWDKGTYAAFTVDGSDLTRIQDRLEIFENAAFTFCIDHHKTNLRFAADNLVDEGASSTGEMVLAFLEHNDLAVDSVSAEALYAAISTDTGSFKYSNTTPETHRAVARLMEIGFDFNTSNIELYQNKPFDRILLQKIALNHLALYENGQIGISYIRLSDVADANIADFDTDGICEGIRDIAGLEVAVFIKENQPGQFKVSMRSKRYVDVAEISLKHGGGGHARAAGCSFKVSLEDVIQTILEAVTPCL